VDEASIRVDRGEIVGLIGPNGAGKTTLVNLISGVTRAGSGGIEVFGNEVVDLTPEYRAVYGVARSFQNARLFPGLTVVQTIQVALSAKNRVGFLSSSLGAPWARVVNRQSRTEALELLEKLNLTPWANSLTSDLSTGTRRICDLAAQLATRPKLLLLDEPTAGVAQRECEMFPPLLRRIRDEMDCSILIVEHDMPMLMSLCDRIYAMETGQVIAEGTPEEVQANPLVIASYLGTDEAAINRSGSNGRARTKRRTPVSAAGKATDR
jgi:ABC-type branched-subunit amino acid transport system ATPase component